MADGEQLQVKSPDRPVDPGVLASGTGRGAGVQHIGESRVDPDVEELTANGAAQPCRNVEAVKRNNAALIGLDQEDAWIIARLAHRKDAIGIAPQQLLRTETTERIGDAEIRFSHPGLRWGGVVRYCQPAPP